MSLSYFVNQRIEGILQKEASRREIREIRDGKLSDKSISAIAKNNIGQRERFISKLPGENKGNNQVADLVLYPGHGEAVRKVNQRVFPIKDVVNNPDHRVIKELKKFQDNHNHHGGFARVYGVDDQRGITFSERLYGQRLSDVSPALKKGVMGSSKNQSPVTGYASRGTVGKIPRDMAATVKHLQRNGFPETWDFNEPRNLMVTPGRSGARLKSFDLQGARGISLVEGGKNYKKDPYHYFRLGNPEKIPALEAADKRREARQVQRQIQQNGFSKVVAPSKLDNMFAGMASKFKDLKRFLA